MRKNLILLFFLIVFFVSTSNTAFATTVFSSSTNLLLGIPGYENIDGTGSAFYNMTDGDFNTYDSIKGSVYFKLQNDADLVRLVRQSSPFADGVKYIEILDADKRSLGIFSLDTVAYSLENILINVNGAKYIHLVINPKYDPRKVYEIEAYGIEIIKEYFITQFKETHTYNNVILSWINPFNSDLESIDIMQDNQLLATVDASTTSYLVKDLLPETEYDFQLVARFKDDVLSPTEVLTVKTDKKISAIDNVTNFSATINIDQVDFTFDLPADDNFSHLQIFRNGNLIIDNYSDAFFTDYNLMSNTNYLYNFVSVSKEGAKSAGYKYSFKTAFIKDDIAPNAPLSLSANVSNSTAKVLWSRNSEQDLAGYNLYLDGVKYNNNLILSNSYILSALVYDQLYKVTVTAVDYSGNASSHSAVLELIANGDSAEIPVVGIENDVDLIKIGDAVGSWFNSFWPILAFSIGIILAFIIGHRIKNLIGS